nr:MAG TPA: hypothetical protein [Caudoviricetes sp.]
MGAHKPPPHTGGDTRPVQTRTCEKNQKTIL